MKIDPEDVVWLNGHSKDWRWGQTEIVCMAVRFTGEDYSAKAERIQNSLRDKGVGIADIEWEIVTAPNSLLSRLIPVGSPFTVDWSWGRIETKESASV